jgi:DNA gyrase inhibitor GyrI
MQLDETPEIVTWPGMHYIFVEKMGAFLDTAPQAWQEMHWLVPEVSAHNEINGYLSLYKLHQQIYRAGVSLAAEPVKLPKGLRYHAFPGGTYRRFVLTGGYSNLPRATLRTFAIVSEKKIRLRDDYNIENYVNDPKMTPQEQLITEILYPVTPDCTEGPGLERVGLRLRGQGWTEPLSL